jgi:hypothetical protein
VRGFRVGAPRPSLGNVQFLSWLYGLRRDGWRNKINYLAGFDSRIYSTTIGRDLQGLYGEQSGAYLSNSFAYRTGTARFDPPNPFRIAKFTPMTFPSRLNNGPPDPPEVVAAS